MFLLSHYMDEEWRRKFGPNIYDRKGKARNPTEAVWLQSPYT